MILCAPFYTETGASLRDTEDRGKEVEPTPGTLRDSRQQSTGLNNSVL